MRRPKPTSPPPDNAQRIVEFFLSAYRQGAFPMAEHATPGTPAGAEDINWYAPDPRAMLPLEENALHIPGGLKRPLKRCPFIFTSDCCFERVIRACAEPTPKRQDSWLNETLIRCYTLLHEHGHAHSIEAWLPLTPIAAHEHSISLPTPRSETPPPGATLVGGIYGVSIGAAFFAESMFSRPALGGSHSSNLSLVTLWHHLRSCGYDLLDVQLANEHTERFGVIEIRKSQYMKLLTTAVERPDAWRSLV